MNPVVVLFFLLAVVPLTELYILLKVGSAIGALATIGLVLLTAFLGTALIRYQGLRTMASVRATTAQGGVPAMELMEGACLLIAGAVLLTPGFLTDAAGFALLVPAVRRALILRYLAGLQPANEASVHTSNRDGHRTIEGDYHRHDD